MSTVAATVSELIESLQQYPDDWPVMMLNPAMNDHRSALHGIYIYEGGTHQVKDCYYEFYERGNIPDEIPTVPALLLGDWERGDK